MKKIIKKMLTLEIHTFHRVNAVYTFRLKIFNRWEIASWNYSAERGTIE